MSRHTLVPTLISISAILTLSGCATPQSGIGAVGDSGGGECNPWVTGAVGAVIGGVLAGGNNTVKGAVAGAAVGALGCIAINATTRQVRTAEAVEQDYRRTNAGSLPSAPRVLTYATRVDPSRPIPAGESVKIRSNIAVVAGRSQPVHEVREELVLTDTSGNEFRRAAKVVGEKGAGSGEYENAFSFKFPEGVSQGVYGVKTALYVNGQKAGERNNRVQLVVNDVGVMQVAMAD